MPLNTQVCLGPCRFPRMQANPLTHGFQKETRTFNSIGCSELNTTQCERGLYPTCDVKPRGKHTEVVKATVVFHPQNHDKG